MLIIIVLERLKKTASNRMTLRDPPRFATTTFRTLVGSVAT